MLCTTDTIAPGSMRKMQAPEPQLEAQHDYDESIPTDESEDDVRLFLSHRHCCGSHEGSEAHNAMCDRVVCRMLHEHARTDTITQSIPRHMFVLQWHGSDSGGSDDQRRSRRSQTQRPPRAGRQARGGPTTRAATRAPSQPRSGAFHAPARKRVWQALHAKS